MSWILHVIRSAPGRFVPFVRWIGELRNTETLRADIIAGITVAVVLVPQSMAYAQLAGLPAHYGLYASFLPPMVASLFGSSRQLATGPVAMVSLMTAAALQPIAAQGTEGYLAYAMLLAVLVGLFQLSLGLLRVGVLMDLVSHPVVVGFTNAGAIIIATSQLDKLFGVTKATGEHHYQTVHNVFVAALESTHWPTLWMAVLAMAIMLFLKRYYPRVPGVLAAVVVTTVIAWWTNFKASGGGVVGEIPEGLPMPTMRGFDMEVAGDLMISAVIISLIGYMEAIAIAKALAARTEQRLDANQELVGQGLGNVVSGFFSGYPVSGSFSRSAVNIDAGAITGFSSIVTGAVVGVTLLFLTPLLYHLPQATLASVIILAVINLVQVAPIIHAWKAAKYGGFVAMATFLFTLYIAPEIELGILLGVLLSIMLFVVRFLRPRVAELLRHGDGTMRDIKVYPELKVSDRIALLRFDGSLFFANASFFEDQVLELIATRPALQFVIIDAQGINEVDSSGEEVLHRVTERLRENGVTVLIANMKHQFMQVMHNTRLINYIGEQHFFSRVQQALDFAWDSLGDSYDRTTCPLRAR